MIIPSGQDGAADSNPTFVFTVLYFSLNWMQYFVVVGKGV